MQRVGSGWAGRGCLVAPAPAPPAPGLPLACGVCWKVSWVRSSQGAGVAPVVCTASGRDRRSTGEQASALTSVSQPHITHVFCPAPCLPQLQPTHAHPLLRSGAPAHCTARRRPAPPLPSQITPPPAARPTPTSRSAAVLSSAARLARAWAAAAASSARASSASLGFMKSASEMSSSCR